ncbi:hypothetical protein [Streptomyces sp. NPDC005438]|uniref:hypothetical protein n=1 Tax=Streptomyces sp. NPDC005438 TaxID=3156880 RepID=UPI0033A08406
MSARSALGTRWVLSLLFVPVFAVGLVVFGLLAWRAGPDSAPSYESLRALTLICAGLVLFSVVDLCVVGRRRRRERRRAERAREERGEHVP